MILLGQFNSTIDPSRVMSDDEILIDIGIKIIVHGFGPLLCSLSIFIFYNLYCCCIVISIKQVSNAGFYCLLSIS